MSEERTFQMTDEQYELIEKSLSSDRDTDFLGEVLASALYAMRKKDANAWQAVRKMCGAENNQRLAIDHLNRTVTIYKAGEKE